MLRIATILLALAALALAGWFGFQIYAGRSPAASIAAIAGKGDDGLPDTADEWRGRIDYRTLDRQLVKLMQRPEMAGLAVAIVEDGKLSFVRTYGVTDRSTGAPVTPQTVFRWASVSKTATGLLAAALSEERALDLERPVASWNTSLRLPNRAESRLTFAQLLSHQTGLTKNAYDEKLEDGQSPDVLRASLSAAPLQCVPGTCHTYQNIAFDAASEILGETAGAPLEQAVSERFFRPLGMASAAYGMEGLTGAKDWAHPHHLTEVRAVKEAYWRVPAAAGIESNIVDFAKWMQAAMGDRPDVLPLSVLQLAQGPRVATPRLYSGDLAKALSDAGYGLGWRSFIYGGHVLSGHSGAVAGYRATMIFDPATRTGVVAMWNSNWGIPFRIPFAVFDSYHQQAGGNWMDLSEIPLPEPEPPTDTTTPTP
ncbi:serine hydrolase domain-containing protein [Sphingorhabdus sp.]|jgi:beta-lactamase class C|uniref:serine hydrolase domain-containing protein n=1 Tax=Sphingorhabdus sp. TaxID=1902408 RepID=UPI003BB0174C|nr:beta-lactamase family protein [Sphingomonadales bacterium]MBL0021366.1 beta-lactamase family protein [Sphingomonadales bacterium]